MGAGKTTFLNNLLGQLKDKKTGVIVNEFGETNVDAKMLDLENDDGIVEINNGSIFLQLFIRVFCRIDIIIQGY
ncbi:Cobalamin synthesis protein/P47K [Halanaerobium saccharolyticum subsp. saccharolyticum DSM 6643]|uniref:Cobalamin synthesis protein/P47K n=1 Tax=Halanaerobium saccharolyticum subsp. saccharolyticum DSM 6643 TaxID=1293054 RepID=M5E067_9FIRM|nr:Cobalamin synthesis protein/P47K [Halanaerobium saccharolyticum subsp. saccharolyticum DSM 6643]